MTTTEFLRKVLPESGVYLLAAFWFGKDGGPTHYPFTDLQEMSRKAAAIDKRGIEVYHACASYITGDTKKVSPNRRALPAKSPRVARNAHSIRAQWMDIDIGGEDDPYSTQRDAAKALAAMCKKLSVPGPMIVSSGRGLHCYWRFNRDVPADEAKPLMRAFARAARDAGFQHDTKRTADVASVLRPVGTTWRKEGEKPVKVLRDAQPIDPDEFYAKFEAYVVPDRAPVDDEWGSGGREYPPSSGMKILRHCRTMAHVAKRKGDVQEPLWRDMLGLMKHTSEGGKLAHAMSKGHPAYDRGETQDKLDRWEAGPPTCESIALNSDKCRRCPHHGKLSSPIHLGYEDPEQAPVPVQPTQEPAQQPKQATPTQGPAPIQQSAVSYAMRLPGSVPFWPKRYRWDGTQVSVFHRDPTDPADPGKWVPMLSKLVYPHMRYPDEDGTMMIRCSYLMNPHRSDWREFDIPAKTLAENKSFANALGAHEVYPMSTPLARHFFQDVIAQMQDMGIETKAYNCFGWHDGGFVIGTTSFSGSGADPVFLSDKLPPECHQDFGVSGTSQEWSELIDEIYNRPGAEPYQFMICAAFGAPLIKLVESNLWHGIPIALTGEGGLGKTTTCLAATSMYGDPSNFYTSTNDDGTTMNALITKVGIMRNLPLVLDEMTGRKTDELQGMLYALSNGRPKQRNRPDGTLIGGNLTWDTFTFITGNMNITAMLAQLDRNRAEATQLRCFEIPLQDGFNDRVFSGLNAKEMIEHRLLGNNYGAAGREYLQYIIKHRKAVAEKLQKLRSKFAPVTRDETRERFYNDTIATALMGGLLAKKLGLIDFDMKAVQAWAQAHIKTLRTNRHNNLSTVGDVLGKFLSELHNRTVVTEHFTASKIRFEVDSSIKNPVARVATEDKKFYVAHAHFTEWCGRNNVNPAWFKDELDKEGHLVHEMGATPDRKVSIFKGTSLPTTQVRVLELDYDMLMARHGSHLKAVS